MQRVAPFPGFVPRILVLQVVDTTALTCLTDCVTAGNIRGGFEDVVTGSHSSYFDAVVYCQGILNEPFDC